MDFAQFLSLMRFRVLLQGSLGVAPSAHNKIFVLSGPVGPYYPTGFKPITLLADPKCIRAAPGGCGAFKMGS